MNSVIIPEETEETPDDLLAEFARRGNRVAVIEEVYRRANGHPSGYAIAEQAGVETDDIEAVADAAWREYADPDDAIDLSDRRMLLGMSYGHVADHVFATVEGATDPTA
jgi:hypothetical protein